MQGVVEDSQSKVVLFGGPRLFVSGEEVRLSPYQRHVLALVSADSASGISRLRAAEILWDEPIGAKHRHRLSQLIYAINRKAGIEVIGGDTEWLRLGSAVEGPITTQDLVSPTRDGDFLVRSTPVPSRSFADWQEECEGRIKDRLAEQAQAALERARRLGDLRDVETALQLLDWIDEEVSGPGHRSSNLGIPELLRSDVGPSDVIGREPEIRRLAANIVTRRAGFSLSVLTGRAGIGKTTLLRELQRRLSPSHSVVYTACREPDRNTVLAPLIDALGGSRFEETINNLESPWKEVVLSLLPEASAADPPYIDPKNVPIRLYEALRRTLEAYTQQGPTLLVIDNFEWSNTTLRAALGYVATHWGQGRTHVAIASRSADAADSLWTTLRSESVPLVEVALEGLDDEAGERLVRALAPDIDDGTVEYLLESAVGHPLLLAELASEAARGSPVHGPGTLPPSIRDIVVRRLRGLAEPERHLLLLLAVLGRPASLKTLASVGGSDLIATSERARALAEIDLVSESEGAIEIRHDLTRRALYDELDRATRALLHRSIGEALEEIRGVPPAELAHHFGQAGVREKTATYARQAADHAEATGGVDEAIGFLRLARQWSDDEVEDVRLLERLALLAYRHEDPTESMPLLELASARLSDIGDVNGSIRTMVWRVDLLRGIGQRPVGELIHDLEQALEAAKQAQAWEGMAEAVRVLIRVHQQAGDPNAAEPIFEEAERIIRETDSAWATCCAHCALAHKITLGDPVEGLQAARAAVEFAEHHTLDELASVASSLLVSGLVTQGLMGTKEGREAVSRADRAARIAGDVQRLVLLLANQGVWCMDTGRHEEAREFFQEALQLVKGPARHVAEGVVHLNLGELALLTTDYESALLHFADAEPIAPSLERGHRQWQWIREAGPGLALLRLGDVRGAQEHMARLPPFPEVWSADPCIAALFRAEMMAGRGAVQEAFKLMDSVMEQVRSRYPIHVLRLSLFKSQLAARFSPGEAAGIAVNALKRSFPPGTEELKSELEGC